MSFTAELVRIVERNRLGRLEAEPLVEGRKLGAEIDHLELKLIAARAAAMLLDGGNEQAGDSPALV